MATRWSSSADTAFPTLTICWGSASTGATPTILPPTSSATREPVIIANVSERFQHFRDEIHGGGRVKGWMGVPLLVGDRLIGMLTLDKLEEGFYTPEHAHVAKAFAPYAATAIERARLFGEIHSLFEEAKDARRRLVDAIENSSDGFAFLRR